MNDSDKSEITDKSLKSFNSKHIRNESGCWDWIASKNSRGYGKLWCNGKLILAHRLSYLIFKGKIQEGLTIDHQCNNRACVNPDHLKMMSQRENSMKGSSPTAINLRKTHCKYGHPLSGDGVSIVSRRDGVRRKCKICHRMYKSKAYLSERGLWK